MENKRNNPITRVDHEVISKVNKEKLLSQLAVGDWFRNIAGVLYIKITDFSLWNVTTGKFEPTPSEDCFVTFQAQVDIKTYM